MHSPCYLSYWFWYKIMYMNFVTIALGKIREVLRVENKQRVELHCHTNKSVLDGVSSVEEILNYADGQGMTAVAITDHANILAYDEISHFGEEHKNLKTIFGMEAYVVDDFQKVVENDKGQQVTDTYVVVELETTGVNIRTADIIEVGAVRVSNGIIEDRFHSYVNIGKPIPKSIAELTGITDESLSAAPQLEDVLQVFGDFSKGAYLVSYNAHFDCSFLKWNMHKFGMEFDRTIVNLLLLSKIILPDLKRYKLSSVVKELGVEWIGEHYNAYGCASMIFEIYKKICVFLSEKGVGNLADLRGMITSNTAIALNLPTYHVSILIKNEIGKKNLYRLISDSEQKHKKRKPIMLWSELLEYREGLLLGSACSDGELFYAVQNGYMADKIEKIAARFDYIEIQPVTNDKYLLDDSLKTGINTIEDIKSIHRSILNVADKLNIPVVATSDVHFLKLEDGLKRVLVQKYAGFADADLQMDLHFRTTEEMLSEFEYLGKDKAWQIVVENTNMIADMISEFPLYPKEGVIMPDVDDADVRLEEICFKALYEKYGQNVETHIQEVLTWELECIKNTKTAALFIITKQLLDDAGLTSYQVGFKGCLGASFVACLCGISCINPIEAELGGKEFLYGYCGDKIPAICLKVPSEMKEKMREMCSSLEGVGAAFCMGYSAAITVQDAERIINEYEQEKGMVFIDEKREELKNCLTNVIERRGIMHSSGIFLVPKEYDIHEFSPVMVSIDRKHIVTAFDSYRLPLYKINLESCYAVNMTYLLMKKTGVDVSKIPLDDKEVLHMFTVYQTEYGFQSAVLGVPEFNYDEIFNIVREFEVDCFQDIVKIIGLAHSIGAWNEAVEVLLSDGIATKEDIISSKEDIYEKLVRSGIERKTAFCIATRLGKGEELFDEEKEIMIKYNIPEWYLELCGKIKHLFSRAHAYRLALDAWWCAWFKLYYPNEFYETYFQLWKLTLND